ncbi:hypothetical protein LOD99_3476 [Oopsacas minuta]|uniref:SRCR domain-containing protein n=1 Tax=Oopsacas minuta TaxID=111878 RepID=A0AAV7JXZ1_9METZ|nr:hypothetical protein LOD99_3476 [Oopsacas minuta]
MFFVTCVIHSILFCILRYGLECFGQEQYSFRQHVDGGQEYLQIFYSSDGMTSNGNYYNIREQGIDYRELYYACRNLSNEEAMVEYFRIDYNDNFNEFEIDCDNLPPTIANCNTLRLRDADRVIDLTCLAYSGYNVGDVRQLEDGRIVQLVDFADGKLVWAHFCYDGNIWDNNVANLACQSLGFEGAKAGMERIKVENRRGVYGLVNINCDGVTSFPNCTSEARDDSANRCMGEDVIALICENFIQTSTQTASINFQSTMNTPLSTQTTMNTPFSTQTNILTSSSSDNPQTNSSVTIISFTTSNITFLAIALSVVLFICVIGGIVLIGIAIYLYKMCHCEKPIEEQEKVENGESDNNELYLNMAPHPNGDIKQVLKKDKLYYNLNEVEDSTQSYQHTYLEMKPGQTDTEQSTIEPLYIDIEVT